jgi:hypothetical protein
MKYEQKTLAKHFKQFHKYMLLTSGNIKKPIAILWGNERRQFMHKENEEPYA